MSVHAHAALEAGKPLTDFTYDPDRLGALEVDINVTHCGVCHTDVGVIDDEWGISSYPVVAGHEVVGVVSAVGSGVDADLLPVGTRVGVGPIAGACMRCEQCLSGRTQLCARRDDTVLRGHRGGFADSLRASDWRFAVPIPDAVASEHAAPLLCAGTTVFAPFLRHDVRPIDHVGVVGIGGLGHLAIQFARAWGCHVTAISSSADKEQEARRLGAHDFVASREPGGLDATANSLDLLICTVSADLPWDDYLATLKPQGRLCILGVPTQPVTLGPMALLPAEKAVSGGVPASVGETRAMFEFVARHGIEPVIERYSFAEINTALDRNRRGVVRYRAVIAN